MRLALKWILMLCLVAAVQPNNQSTTTAPAPVTTTTVTTTTAPAPVTTTTAPAPVTTTTAPAPVTTTTAPAPVTTTTAPAPVTTTTAPAPVTTTTAPAPVTTTTAPAPVTTTTAPAPVTTTTAPAPVTTTAAPTTSGTPGTTVSTTTTATTTKGPCTPNPCVGNGICEERHGGDFVCTCRPGLVYDNTTGCMPAKVFPGDLTLDKTFQDGMSDRTSQVFRETAEGIQQQLRAVLQGNPGYMYSIVLSLKPGSIIAEVQNFYEVSSDATTESVGNLIKEAIDDDRIANATFETKSVCAIGFCDVNTTTCEGDGTAVCTCLNGYIKSQFTTQSCISCPYGEKAVGSESCKKCGFGFSGFNCNDPYLLVVVVVSCVLGSLLIIFIVALIVVSSRKQKVITSQPAVFQQDFSNVEMHKPVGVPRIPRVNPISDWQPANLEVTNSGSTEALVIKNKREDKSPYSTYDNDSDDGKYKNHNPSVYGGVKVMENGLRGNQNSYYRQDEDRMRRY